MNAVYSITSDGSVQQVEKGVVRCQTKVMITHLAKDYIVGRATIYDINKKMKGQNKAIFKNNESFTIVRKTWKLGDFLHIEDTLYAWFMQERGRHTPISGKILMEKQHCFIIQLFCRPMVICP